MTKRTRWMFLAAAATVPWSLAFSQAPAAPASVAPPPAGKAGIVFPAPAATAGVWKYLAHELRLPASAAAGAKLSDVPESLRRLYRVVDGNTVVTPVRIGPVSLIVEQA